MNSVEWLEIGRDWALSKQNMDNSENYYIYMKIADKSTKVVLSEMNITDLSQ